MASERLSAVLRQISPANILPSTANQLTNKDSEDIVITLAIRTPLTKAGKGGFKDTALDYMIYSLLQKVVERSQLNPELVEDICCGNVSDGQAAYKVRAAALAAGFPNTTAASTVNRFCSSGLKAVEDIANAISHGDIEIGLALGAESMSNASADVDKPFHPDILRSSEAKDCLQPMGQTSENVGRDFDIPRDKQDLFAAESFNKAEKAQKEGYFDDEIVPITTSICNSAGQTQSITVNKDEGVRYGTTYESLSKIRPAFPQFGDKSTGGNSSQVTDGAAAILMMKRSRAEQLGQPILAKYVGATVAGLAPRIMGIGPSIAIPKLLKKHNVSIDDCDVIEINEAFASMAVYCRDILKIPAHKLNPRGGAIALGHPLGATGARQIVTGLSECRRRKERVLLTSMCIGTGQGMAALFVNECL